MCVDDDMEVWPACSEFGATDHRDDYVGVVGPGGPRSLGAFESRGQSSDAENMGRAVAKTGCLGVYQE